MKTEETNHKIKIPPITITNLADIPGYIKRVQTKLDSEAKFQVTKNGVKVYLSTLEFYNSHKQELHNNNNIQFYTHPIPSEKSKNLVLKGMPSFVTPDEIIQDLKDKELAPIKCVIMKRNHMSKNTDPLYLVSFENKTNLNQVLRTKYICSMKIYWDKYRNSKRVTQCHRCQQFGHGTTNCRLPPKCVKCIGNHLTSQCQKTQEQKPQCVNCKGEHPANYSKCEVYLKRLETIDKLKESQEQIKTSYVNNTSEFPLPKWNKESTISKTRTWVSKNQNQNGNKNVLEQVNDIQELKQELDNLNAICNIKEMISLIRNLNSNLKTCSNKLEQIQVIQNILQNE